MSVSYGVSGTSPFSDFTTDLENLVITYIYTKWSLTGNLAKPLFEHATGQDLEFRPGFDRGRPSFQVLCIQTDTEVRAKQDVAQRSWEMVTRLEITVITNVLNDLDNVRPELGRMEREVQRILNQYKDGDIVGIDRMYFTGQTRVYDDIVAGGTGSNLVRGSRGSGGRSSGANWQTQRWKTRIFAECVYYKDDIS